MAYKYPETEFAAGKLLEDLKKINGNNFSDSEIMELGTVLTVTSHPGLRDIIALRFSETKSELVIPFLVQAIKSNIHTKHISTLIYSCSHFECSEHLQLFIDLMILKTDISFFEAIYAIKNIKRPIGAEESLYAINKLKAHKEQINSTIKFNEEINLVIEIIENWDNTPV